MAFYDVCKKCGAHLDPGERCDCEDEQERRSEFYAQRMRANRRTGQYTLILERRELSNATKIAN